MTHGCIEIYKEGEKRFIRLHTYHTGDMIPELVEKAIDVLVKDKKFFIELNKDLEITEEVIRDHVTRMAATDGIDYAPCVASWLVGAYPNFLSPVPNDFLEDLPSWAGQDYPYKLIVSEDEWKLYDEEGKLILEFDPTQKFIDKMVELGKKK